MLQILKNKNAGEFSWLAIAIYILLGTVAILFIVNPIMGKGTNIIGLIGLG